MEKRAGPRTELWSTIERAARGGGVSPRDTVASDSAEPRVRAQQPSEGGVSRGEESSAVSSAADWSGQMGTEDWPLNLATRRTWWPL